MSGSYVSLGRRMLAERQGEQSGPSRCPRPGHHHDSLEDHAPQLAEVSAVITNWLDRPRLERWLRLPLPAMYSASFPLTKWTGSRREAINTLARAHATLGEVDGPGRPLEIGRPVAHAYVLRVVAEFQGFARDLLDLGTEKIVELSGVRPQFRPLLITAAADGRRVDRGNANLDSLANDFKRIGISGLSAKLATRDRFWGSATGRNDQASFADLLQLRNCLAHGNQSQLDRLRSRGVPDTLTWARRQLPGLDRTARALDRIVWEHLSTTFGSDPW